MKPKLYQVVRVYVTPKHLREVADTIERRMAQARLGEDVPKVTLYGDGVELDLVADQDAFHKKDTPLNPWS